LTRRNKIGARWLYVTGILGAFGATFRAAGHATPLTLTITFVLQAGFALGCAYVLVRLVTSVTTWKRVVGGLLLTLPIVVFAIAVVAMGSAGMLGGPAVAVRAVLAIMVIVTIGYGVPFWLLSDRPAGLLGPPALPPRASVTAPPTGGSLSMNTAQLMVLWYGCLVIVGLCLFYAFMGQSIFSLLAAVGLLTALAIYTLKPHPTARKRTVAAGVMIPPLVLASALWAFVKQNERIAAEREAAWETEQRATRAAEEATKRAALAAEEAQEQEADAQRRAADAAFQSEIAARVPHDGRWLPVALGADHSRYFIDLETVEVVTRQPNPPWPMGANVALGTTEGTRDRVPSLQLWLRMTDYSEAQGEVTQLTVACQGHEITPWTYKPGTVAETIDRWAERSKWCEEAEAAGRAQASISAEKRREDDLKSLYVMGIDNCSREFRGSALTACIRQETDEARAAPLLLCKDNVCCPIEHPSLGTDGNCHAYGVYPTSKDECVRDGAGSKECGLLWSSTGQTAAYGR
jgi:hypothetical protein